jgi:hypothetical protein
VDGHGRQRRRITARPHSTHDPLTDGTHRPGPALDIEEEGGAQEEPAPAEADEVLGDDWNDHLGWDADANIAAAEAPAPAEDVLTDPRIARGL